MTSSTTLGIDLVEVKLMGRLDTHVECPPNPTVDDVDFCVAASVGGTTTSVTDFTINGQHEAKPPGIALGVDGFWHACFRGVAPGDNQTLTATGNDGTTGTATI